MATPTSLSDSTDWLPTALPTLAPLDAALRCQVCKDFFASPMMTSCAHTFCSLCIRRCLAADGKCPACRAADQDSKLRRNWAVQEMVDAFVAARPGAMALAKREREGEGEGMERPRKRRRGEEGGGEVAEGRKTRSSTRKVLSSGSPEIVDLVGEDENEEDDEYQPEDGLVACPICTKRMKAEAVFPHLDSCTGEEDDTARSSRSRPRATINNSLGFSSPQKPPTKPPPSRLPQLNYSLMTDNQLRKKLKELGIPGWGNKTLLIRRHTEWQNLWNSNIDSIKPRSKNELLSELGAWERSQGGLAKESGANAIMKKDFDGQGWAQSNRSQFDDLIAQARRKREKPAEAEEKKSEDSSEVPSSAPQTNSVSASPTPQPDHDHNGADAPAAKPYQDHPEALSRVRERVHEVNLADHDTAAAIRERLPDADTAPSIYQNNGYTAGAITASDLEPLKAKAMFEVPADPIMDVDSGETAAER